MLEWNDWPWRFEFAVEGSGELEALPKGDRDLILPSPQDYCTLKVFFHGDPVFTMHTRPIDGALVDMKAIDGKFPLDKLFEDANARRS